MAGALPVLFRRFGLDRSFAGYVGVSAAALAADFACLDRMLIAGVDESVAAALAYSLGIALHWLLSTRFVFPRETASRGSAARQRQKLLFAGSA
jgi:putative flippase GtrA